MSVAILIKEPQFLEKSTQLATAIQYPLVQATGSEYDYYLVYSTAGLTLESTLDIKFKPLLIDFVHGKTAQRLQQATIKKEAIAKAFGLHKGKRPHILDCTAGLGRDAMLLSKLGCRVDMLERSPTIYALLADALERARAHQSTDEISRQVRLFHMDAQDYFKHHPKCNYEAIYLDPMFPEKKKSALAQKEMQLFKNIVGGDADAKIIFNHCQQHYSDRLVVKRARLAPLLAKAPSYQLIGKANRFDVYLSAA